MSDETTRARERALDVRDDAAVFRVVHERTRRASDPLERLRERLAVADKVYRDDRVNLSGVLALMRYASKRDRTVVWLRGTARRRVPDTSLGTGATFDRWHVVQWRHFALCFRDRPGGYYALEIRTGNASENVTNAFPEVLQRSTSGPLEGLVADADPATDAMTDRARAWALAPDSRAILFPESYVGGEARGRPMALWDDPQAKTGRLPRGQARRKK